jgi:hypothetical protein
MFSTPRNHQVITGDDIAASGGIDKFPVTVTNPGTDVSAYFSCPVWVTGSLSGQSLIAIVSSSQS